MAYSDYGAFVWLNGMRREDKEDVATFASDEETFGTPSENIPSGMRIWVSLSKAREEGKEIDWVNHIHHGILGDGNIRVMCHKQGLPTIIESVEGEYKRVEYYDKDTDSYDYGSISYDYKGYKFLFVSGKPYYAKMTTPEGDEWECKYDYEYGAGFE